METVIGIVAIIVTLVALLYHKEIRQFLGLDKPKDDASTVVATGPVQVNTYQPKANITYAMDILGKHVDAIEATIGQPSDIATARVGQQEPMSDGGEVRYYDYKVGKGKGLLSVSYDKEGIAKGIRLEGLANVPLFTETIDNWCNVLHTVGISVSEEPDIKGPQTRQWSNYKGYHITVANNRAGGVITYVRIYKVPPPPQ